MLSTIGAENSVPDVERDAKVVIPHPPGMMKVMHRADQPKAALGVFMLKLVRIRSKGGVEQGAGHEPNPRLPRVQKACRKQRPRTARVAEKFTQKSLPHAALVMLNVFCTLQPKMHHAVSPILRKGTDYECQECGGEPNGHDRSVTPHAPSCQSKRSVFDIRKSVRGGAP